MKKSLPRSPLMNSRSGWRRPARNCGFFEGIASHAGDVWGEYRTHKAFCNELPAGSAYVGVWEPGVRFVMLMQASWDDHTNINRNLKENCLITDQPAAALIEDLKHRGLLDSTLVVWGGEFGRTPRCEIRNPSDAENAGRDHNPLAYSNWMGRDFRLTDVEGNVVKKLLM